MQPAGTKNIYADGIGHKKPESPKTEEEIPAPIIPTIESEDPEKQ